MNEDTKGESALEKACAAVGRDRNPAYVKDSELRYVAVNEAYAALWDTAAANLIGAKSHHHFDAAEQNDRDEKERRSLVFGKDQTALFAHPLKEGRYRIRIRRERHADGKPFIIGHFEPIAGVRFETGEIATAHESDRHFMPPDTAEPVLRGDHDLLKAAIERAPVPMGVLDASGRVLAASQGFRAGSALMSEIPLPGGGRLHYVMPQPGREEFGTPSMSSVAQVADTLSARLRESLDCIDAGIVIYDPDDVVVYVNPAMREMSEGAYRIEPGMTLREVLLSAWEQMTDSDDEAKRDDWVARRTAAQHNYGATTVERIGNGRWLRFVHRKLADGSTLGLRMDISDLIEHERALEEKVNENSLYRAVLDALPIASFIKDENFRYVYGNSEMAKLAGFALEDIIGKDDLELHGPQFTPIRESDIDVLANGVQREIELPIRRPQGDDLTLLTRKTRFTAPNGRNYLLGSTFDISSIRQREQEVDIARQIAEQHRSDLESTLDAMQMGVVVVDRDLKIELANDAFFEIWMIQPYDEIIGEHFRDFMNRNRQPGTHDVSDEDWNGYVEMRLGEIIAGYVEPREIGRKNGSTVVYSVRPLSGGKRLLTYYDITELKRREMEVNAARQELERAGALMQAATRAMAQGMFIIDEHQVLFANGKFLEMLDVPAEIVQPGSDWRDFLDYCIERGDYDSTGREQARRDIVGSIEHNEGYTVERRMANGHWLRIDALPADNNVMVVTYTDVTEAKEREAQLNELLGKAEIADRAKSEFLANMSHEIRTPMNGVLGMAELLSRTNLDARQRTFTDIIVKSGTALLTIINDILDFSKIDAGQMVLDEAPFDLRETVEDVATLVSARAVEKDVELIVRIDPTLESRVIGDVGRVRQVITNIAGNAVKFTETGHVLIELSCERRSAERLGVTIRVEDTGIGIPADKLGDIFEKFSQVDNSSTRRHEGTGLGLAITSRLVELMGGTIRAESEYGKGSVFTVELEMPIDKKPVRSRPVPVDVTGSRILVIDDNPVNRAILIEQLSAWGFDACAAESGAEGEQVLAVASQHGISVDAVILDYHMPERNGASVARSIRRTYPAADLPIVMLTSMDVRAAEPGFNEIGVQTTLMKPARSSLLLETIVEVLQASRTLKPAAAAPQAARPEPVAAPAPAPVTPIRPAAPVAAEPRPATGLDILIAEDNEVNQIVFTQILEDMGLRYLIVDNGAAAVETWKQLRPSMILMDVSMPVMNGHQATGAIREAEAADASLGRTPIVGVTAHALTGDRERCIEAGMDDYLSKPISPEKLEAKVREWLPAEAVARMAQG